MKISELWLREWANPPLTTDALVEQLSVSGLEVDSAEPVALVQVGPNPGVFRAELQAALFDWLVEFSRRKPLLIGVDQNDNELIAAQAGKNIGAAQVTS